MLSNSSNSSNLSNSSNSQNTPNFNINNLNVRISYPQLITNIYGAIAWCDERKDEISFKYDLKLSYKSWNGSNEFIKSVRSLLQDMGYNTEILQVGR